MKNIVVIGAGGHAVSVANVIQTTNYKLKGFVDRNRTGETLLGHTIYGDESEFFDDDFCFFVAIGTNFLREHVAARLIECVGHERLPWIAHASSSLGVNSSVGPGTVVMPNVTVGPNTKIGRFCLLNTNASIDHDSVMQDYASLAPGVHTGGNVRIEERSAISIGTTVRHGIRIGADTVIGAASYVHEDIGSNAVAYGIPAKTIRRRARQDHYL